MPRTATAIHNFSTRVGISQPVGSATVAAAFSRLPGVRHCSRHAPDFESRFSNSAKFRSLHGTRASHQGALPARTEAETLHGSDMVAWTIRFMRPCVFLILISRVFILISPSVASVDARAGRFIGAGDRSDDSSQRRFGSRQRHRGEVYECMKFGTVEL